MKKKEEEKNTKTLNVETKMSLLQHVDRTREHT